ncbi:GLUG motif-containing protein [Clostridium sp. AM49-4BH]|uniref:GLUG motif-containing protein n=1 Tax=Clostridium sp. AM49-4BH TaxID=2293035 RepID=UPI0015FB29F5|nr:GLUG motif-containing protein [Clostridium sp. AM49-4BH]
MKQRKRGARRIFAGAMAALMVLSAADVSGWGVMNAKAEETTVGTTPQYLTIGSTKIIDNGKFQNNEVSGNDTIYQGTNWYYDSTKNQLVLENASISGHITSMNGDLSIILSGTNTMKSEMLIQSISTESGIVPTLEINGNNHNGSLSCGTISVGDDVSNNNNLNIIGATLETSEIDCSGIVTIENSHVVANDDSSTVISGDKINIVDSFVEAKATTERYEGKVIRSNQPINVSGSQIVVSRALDCSDPVLSDCSFSNSVITKKWKDYETKDNVTKTYVYGTAALKEDLTIASGESIEFESGASITNPEKLTLADGASLLVDGEEHTHNKDGDVTYTWKDDKEHIKNVACKDCPIGYVTKETESHSIGENGFCACNEVYQPAKLTTDKYDIDGDDSKDAVYEISNAGQLYWFVGLVNGTLSGETQNASANAVLTADIVVNKNVLKSDGTVNEGTFKEWTPIATSASPYTGIFEGQNHTISGLYFKQETSFVGLFSVNSGKIANVGILDSYFYGQPYKGWQVGGVCGSNTNQGAITNCYNTGIVRGSETVGGVCGSNYGTITNCSNKGNVGEDDESVGGVCGSNYGTITNCNNAGIVSGKSYVGGVCGKNSNGGTVTNCNNTGEVRGTSQYIGGLSGDNDSSSITNCNNTGEVKATGKFVGGLSGGNYNNGTITNCYYDSTVYTGTAIGDDMGTTEKVEGKTTEQYKTGEVAYLLSQGCSTGEGDDTVTYDGSIWGQTIGTDNYPTLGGAKVYKNAIYNGCVGKPGEPVSYKYSNTEKNTYGEHPDLDNDGKCDDCGAIIDGIGAKLAGYSLSLTGNIGVNFYMELSNKIIADKDAYMQFTLPNGTVTKVLVSEAQTNTTINAEKTYYRFPCEVASYEMTQDIKAQMFDGNGKCGKEYTYTVRDYAQYLIDHVDLYQDAYPFAVAMLNYGACSQKYFNKAVDELANKYLNDNELEIQDRFDGYINGFVANKAENKVLGQFAGLSMVLKSETTLNIFYEPKEGIDVSKLNFIVDGKEITPVKRGQYYILSLENIKANELGNSKKFTVTDGTNTLSGDYCAMMYCYQVLQAQEGTYEDALVTLVKAFSNYAYTARSICQSN